ncbi:MAG: beta-propeller domain-containing protein [Verrucomicrobia bacterium]|nr:beta-propeller domain-containing protein [Verrucomicrobiota bacterium]MCF7707448.1 beta-propeller domain-containing protein [Verrucomicrobiota bacterium]
MNIFKSISKAVLVTAFLLSATYSSVAVFISPPNGGEPVISSIEIEGTNVVVTAQIPEGIKKVTLESRERLGDGAWVPRKVVRLDGTGGEVEITVPQDSKVEMLRVRADASEELPAEFYKGTNDFIAGATDTQNGVPVYTYWPEGVRDDVTAAPGEAKREVVESDIWKIEGEKLYFFNQYRGLQIVDLANPDQPVLKATHGLPASGEQMYLIGGEYAVLLVQSWSYTYAGNDAQSAILVLSVADDAISEAARLPVPGRIMDSRLVGSALYVVSDCYRPVEGSEDGVWEWGTQVSSFDLSNPAAPAEKGSLWYPGYGNLVHATDEYLFVVQRKNNDWSKSVIRMVDISSPDGAMTEVSEITPSGRVPDKFKMNLFGNVFSVISETRTENRGIVTTLENFSLDTPESPSLIGSVELGEGEQLHATRFAGDTVYVVTFFRVDPLWIVDNSDPANPTIKGELEVPGWSTYIHPLGDRLLTVGIDNSNSWRVAVSLFDVADPADPSLLSKVLLGENHSWSEANADEKAFGVLPEAGLVLVPYSGDTTNGYASNIQLIDLNENELVKRGEIEHSISPRRATVFEERIISLSGWELLSVDATDRDNPVKVAEVQLAWPVDRVFFHNDYLIELNENAGVNSGDTCVRVAAASEPNVILGEYNVVTNSSVGDMSGIPLKGADIRGDYLYLIHYIPNDESYQESISKFILTTLDISNLPEIAEEFQGIIGTQGQPYRYSSSWTSHWLSNDLCVWELGSTAWPVYWDVRPIMGVPVADYMPIPWYGNRKPLYYVFDVQHPREMDFIWFYEAEFTNSWNYSRTYAVEDKLYFSYCTSKFVEGLKRTIDETPDAETNQTSGTWVSKNYLEVVDLSDPENPTPRKPVNISGTLEGVERNGALLYTLGNHFDVESWKSDGYSYIDALAYDGVSAHLVDSLRLPTVWPRPMAVVNDYVIRGIPQGGESKTNVIEVWNLNDSGEFEMVSSISVESPASAFYICNDLLISENSDREYLLFDVKQLPQLDAVGKDSLPLGVYGNFQRADGSAADGVWAPLGYYGVGKLDVGFHFQE